MGKDRRHNKSDWDEGMDEPDKKRHIKEAKRQQKRHKQENRRRHEE